MNFHDARPVASPLHDPTGTAKLRQMWRGDMDSRWAKVKRLARASIAQQDPLIHVAHVDRVGAFNHWLDDVMRQTVTEGNGAWMAKYLDAAFRMAKQRSGRLVQAQDAGPEDEPRDEHGKWTTGGGSVEFVSPNVGNLGFKEAFSGLNSERQHKLQEASADIDKALKLESDHADVVGAWSDGAENSVMDTISNVKWTDWNKVEASAAMKGWLADQKSVLAFQHLPDRKAPSSTMVRTGKQQTEVQINPNERDIRSMAKEGPVRVLIDSDGNLYAWDANAPLIHAQVSSALDLDERHQDTWRFEKGRLVSDRIMSGGEAGAVGSKAASVREASAEVRGKLDSLEGNSVLMEFEARGELADIHKNLLADGLAFHTLKPHKDGATVYAVAVDKKDVAATVASVNKAAERYDSEVTFHHGRGEFIGTFSDKGSDREQRDAARSVYEGYIRQSTVPRVQEIWQGVRDHWQPAFEGRKVAKDAAEDRELAVAALAQSELQGVCDATAQQATRLFAQGGLVNKSKLANAIAKQIDQVGKARSHMLVDTLTIKAFSVATLDAFRRAGITHVGTMPERQPQRTVRRTSVPDAAAVTDRDDDDDDGDNYDELVEVLTAGDDDVCVICEDISEEGPYEIDDAESLIPAHPRCRCAFVPADDARFADVRDFDPDEPRDPHGRWTALGGSQGHESTISSRNITASGKTKEEREHFDKMRQHYNRIDIAALHENPDLAKHNIGLFRDARFYLGMQKGELTGKSTAEIANAVRDRMADNLVWLANKVKDGAFGSKDDFKNWGGWYEGAHKIADAEAKKAGIDVASASGVIAALSPQNDWFANVYQAQTVMDALKNKRDMKWDDKMEKTAQKIWSKSPQKAFLPAIQGKSLREVEGNDDAAHVRQAMWIRTENEAHSDRSYREVKPDGTFGDKVKTKAGKDATAAWKATGNIANAVAAYHSGGDPHILQDAMGEKHKVPSFYNNILDPDSKNGDVTIDTHAVGAAWLTPSTQADVSVVHNLASSIALAAQPEGYIGQHGSAETGVQGTYAVYADAYRQAAKAMGIQPRQLQSITWEAKQRLFSEKATGSKIKTAVGAVWKDFNKGKLDLKQARDEVWRVSHETIE